MDPFYLWLESSAFSVWMRESPSFFAFPAMLTVHTVGMGMAAGINAAVALRVLGVSPRIPVKEMRRFLPIMWLGFWLNFATGIALLIAYPTKALTNPVFYLKLACIGIALVIIRWVNRNLFRDDGRRAVEPRTMKFLAIASLVCWAGAITAGRLLAYTHSRLLADF